MKCCNCSGKNLSIIENTKFYCEDCGFSWPKGGNNFNELQCHYAFKVKPEHRCEGLGNGIDKYPEDYYFMGVVQWSSYYKEWYLTTDGITYVKLEHAYDIDPVYPLFD